MTPEPLHCSQAPFELKLNSAGVDLVRRGEGLADVVHDPGVGRRVRAGGRADRRLVDDDRLGMLGQEHVLDQRALAGSGDAGDGGQDRRRDVDVDVLEVVRAGAADLDPAGRRAHVVLDRERPAEEPPGQRVGVAQVGERALEHDPPAAVARLGAHVDDVVGDLDDVGIVLDDDDRVALVAQLRQQLGQAVDVAWVQARCSARRGCTSRRPGCCRGA